jgi:carboxynorspermidine decarboxylase
MRKKINWTHYVNEATRKAGVKTPFYLVSEAQIEKNLKTLNAIQERTGCEIIMALKGFSMFSMFPIIREYLHGTSASSLNEARLGAEEFGKQVHIFAPAYRDEEFPDILKFCDHIVFNSFVQWEKFKPQISDYNEKHPSSPVSCGIRVNPEHSEVKTEIYNPSRRFSRLGVTAENFLTTRLDGISGLHFHNLCELNADSLARTLKVIEKKFGEYIDQMEWINFGGGHHITREDYDVDLLCKLINDFSCLHPKVKIYLEPGEAIALNAGVFVATVMDVVSNEKSIAILDASFAAHMPDFIEMPYRFEIVSAGKPGEYRYGYILGGNTCLAGDDTSRIGRYTFTQPLRVGQPLIFLDMAHYTMVKNNTFNGINLPSIVIRKKSGKTVIVKQFGYEDFKNRLS